MDSMSASGWVLKTHAQDFFTERGTVTCINAPTGIGKSTCAMTVLESNPQFFGRTLFIFPTSVAMRSIIGKNHIPHLRGCTPNTAIRLLVKEIKRIDTIVLDEAHFNSREYYSIHLILSKLYRQNVLRIIMLSATLDEEFIHDNFQDARFIRVQNPLSAFHIEIRYSSNNFGINIYSIGHEVINVIRNHISSVDGDIRCICFVATHEHCERLKKMFIKEDIHLTPLVLHGGLTEEEIEKTRNEIINPRIFVFAQICSRQR